MRKLLILILTLNTTIAFSQDKDAFVKLETILKTQVAATSGKYGVAYKDLSTGKKILINPHQSFHAASTMKTPVMIEVFTQAAAGKFSLTDSIIVKNKFKSIVDESIYSLDSINDSEHALYKQIGQKKAIKDLVYKMIIVSSNFATNLIIDLVGAENVTRTMRKMKANEIQIRRGVEDAKAFEKGLNNTTTAYDLMTIFSQMASGKIVSQNACDQMIAILLDQKFNSAIPALLPKNVKVAHKTGSISKVQHDSGIVFLPDGRKYVLVILTSDWTNEGENLKFMAGISKMVYESIYK